MKKNYTYPDNRLTFRSSKDILVKLNIETEKTGHNRSKIIRIALNRYFNANLDDPRTVA